MTIYNFYAVDSTGNTIGFAETDTWEVSKSGMLALGYKYFPNAMSSTEELVLRYPPSLREDFSDIRLSVKQANQILDKTVSDRTAYNKK